MQDSLSVHFSSDKHDWATPQEFYDALDAEFGFTVDVCASEWNAKHERFWTVEDDALSLRHLSNSATQSDKSEDLIR